MNRRKLYSHRSMLAFSLLELTVSLAVVGVVAVIAMPVYRDALKRTQLTLVRSRCHDLSLSYRAFYLGMGYGPETNNSCIIEYPGSDYEKPISKINPYEVFRSEFLEEVKPDTFMDPFATFFEFPPHMFVPPKKCFYSLFNLPFPKNEGCVLASRGPDGCIDKPSAGFTNQHMQYSPTNGIVSNGDLFFSIPEEEEVRLNW